MIEAAAPAAAAAPTQATPNANPASSDAPQGTQADAVVQPEKPRAKVGEVEWEQDEDGEWYSTQKVNGKDERISHQQALSAARQMKAATERFQEAKSIERQVEGLLANAASTPRATANFLAQLGVDVVAFAESILGDTIAESKLTAEQRRIRELETQAERWQRQEQERAQREHEAKVEAYNRRSREAYVQAFDQQLDALHAPKSAQGREWLHRRIASLATHAEDNGIPTDLTTLTKQAAREFQEMTGTKWVAPTVAPAKPQVRVPDITQQGNNGLPRNQQNGRFVPRNDPKPALIPGDADSVRAIAAWAARQKR